MSTGEDRVISDSCNATERVGSQLKICNLPIPHPGKDHEDGDHTWAVERSSYAGEVTTEVKHG